MTLIEIILLALALAVDAFSVGAAVGLRHRAARQIFRLSLHFGVFQSLMTLLGVLAGTALVVYIRGWDHWVAFGLLAFVGGRMIYGAFRPDNDDAHNVDLTRGFFMVGLSVAVSIDALAAGIGLAAAHAPRALAVGLIGVTAALATVVAMLLSKQIGARIGNYCEIGAGVVLIGIGVRIVATHWGA